MLVLSRRLGEQIVIGGEIRITVVAVQGNKVRIGITAPPDIRVDREEISQRLRSKGVSDVRKSSGQWLVASEI